MIGKLLVLTLRNLKKNLLYTVLVITGLAIGVTTFLSTVQWSAWQLSYDRRIPRGESVYRLTFEEINEGFYRHTARILQGDILNRMVFSGGIAGIEKIGRLAPFRKAAFNTGEDNFYEEYGFQADPAFLDIFQPEVIMGKRTGLLEVPSEAILTESAARRIYGDDDPLGKTFDVTHQFDVRSSTYTVVSVIRDFPPNSHLKISAVMSFDDPMDYRSTAWAYVRLAPDVDPGHTEENLKTFIEANFQEEYARRITPHLQPVTRIHLHSHKARELQPNFQFRTVLVLIIAGMMVFLLAWFNFTLLSFSQNQLHIQRLVVQWQMGAGKSVFFRQFLTEHLLVGLASFVAGLLITLALMPTINRLGGGSFSQDPLLFLISVLLLLVFILASAVITAWISTGRLYRHLQYRYLSSRIDAPPDTTGRNIFIRSVIVLEFMITFVLVSNLILISRQIDFAMNSLIGADHPEAIQIYNLHRTVVDKYATFKEMMLESPAVAMVSASMEEPTRQTMDANKFEINGVDQGDRQLFLYVVDEDFLRFYDLDVLYGKGFPETYDPNDSSEFFVLNETAARMLTDKPESLVGSTLTLHFGYPGFIWPGPITGIVKDFHISGLENEISPMVIFPKYTWLYCFSVLPEGNMQPVEDQLKKVWKELFPDYPLEYVTSNELIEFYYRAEITQTQILKIFSLLSVIIAGLGLFALSGLFMHRKVKAAAIRKINGATLLRILWPELMYYLWLALVSSALSVPASYFLVERWMRNFQYRVGQPWWIYPACALVLVLFSWLAVMYHAFRLARINPSEFIKEQ